MNKFLKSQSLSLHICVHVCIFGNISKAHLFAHIHACMVLCSHMHMYNFVLGCIHMYTLNYLSMCTQVSICVHIFIYIYGHLDPCICVHVCIYVHVCLCGDISACVFRYVCGGPYLLTYICVCICKYRAMLSMYMCILGWRRMYMYMLPIGSVFPGSPG